MTDTIHRGHNAVVPSRDPEMLSITNRVTAIAIAQNIGTTIAALLFALRRIALLNDEALV